MTNKIFKVALCYMEDGKLEWGSTVFVSCDHEPNEDELKDNYMVVEEMENNDCDYVGTIYLSSMEEAEEHGMEVIPLCKNY